jgi:hypothetical protein
MSTWHARSKLRAFSGLRGRASGCEPLRPSARPRRGVQARGYARHGAFDAKVGAEAITHLNDLSRLPFRQQIDLQIEMIPPVGDDAHPVLSVRKLRSKPPRAR